MLPSCSRGAFNGCVQHTLFMGRWFHRFLGAEVGYSIPIRYAQETPATPDELKLASGKFYYNQAEMLNFDMVLAIGQHVSLTMKKRLRAHGIPLVIIRLGNDLIYDSTHMMASSRFRTKSSEPQMMGSIVQGEGYDECWISPHFAYAIDYYSYVSRLPLGKTRVLPYFWDSIFIEKQMMDSKKELMPLKTGNVRVAVFESNQTMNKSMFMPLAALHYADAHYTKAYIMCCANLKNKDHAYYSTFLSYCKKCDGVNKGKVSFESRLPMLKVMTNYANVVLSWQRDWSLNYLTLECLYLGIPIVHNCPEMKHFGFYYHENNLAEAVAHIKRLNEQPFDRDAYRKRTVQVMKLYGPEKPELLAFILERVKSLVKSTKAPRASTTKETGRVPATVRVEPKSDKRDTCIVEVEYELQREAQEARDQRWVSAFM